MAIITFKLQAFCPFAIATGCSCGVKCILEFVVTRAGMYNGYRLPCSCVQAGKGTRQLTTNPGTFSRLTSVASLQFLILIPYNFTLSNISKIFTFNLQINTISHLSSIDLTPYNFTFNSLHFETISHLTPCNQYNFTFNSL